VTKLRHHSFGAMTAIAAAGSRRRKLNEATSVSSTT
jgi:hypothetical protein